MSLGDALTLGRSHGVDLVEIAPNAAPPVCRLVDYGKFRYEQSKKDKDSKKHQHANRVKEVQLSPKIDPHDLATKLEHAVDFLCEDMKVKITLKFRGREMQHTDIGFQVVQKFLQELAPFGHPDAEAKLMGRGLNVMVSPLPRNKRAKNPRQEEGASAPSVAANTAPSKAQENHQPAAEERPPRPQPSASQVKPTGTFVNNPFEHLEIHR
ncbi:Translation initiation factor IF-3 [Verrucomicrobia bacterium]|nr:Translation initiation factor IF-3 [Verrucomicrobiota bacterium]